MKTKRFTPADVEKTAQSAQIPVSDEQKQTLASGFTTTMAVVDQLFRVNIDGTPSTAQVTDLENVLREDEVDIERMLTQEQALANAHRTHNGFFMVDRILEE